MRWSTIVPAFAVLGIAMLPSGGALAACTASTIAGLAGFLADGAITSNGNSVPAAAVGLATFDGATKVSGSLTYSVNGQISRGVPFAGTYSLSASDKCIFVMSTNLLNVDFVLDATGDGFGIDVDTGRTLVFDFIPRQPSMTCAPSLVNGTYGLTLRGDRIGGDNPGPRAGAGWYSADGVSKLSGVEAQSENGTIVSGSAVGTFSVNADCTGSGSVSASFNDGSRSFDMIILNGGATILGIQTDAGRVITFKLNKQ